MKIWAWGTVVISTLSLSVFACGGGKATTTTTTGSPTGTGGSSGTASSMHTSSTTGATTGGGGTPGTGGSGGTGGGAPACGITYDSRPACESCMENSCCSELMACGPGTDCNAFITCASATTCDATCQQACATAHAQGVTDFQTVTQCYDKNCRNMQACEYPICTSMLSFPDMACAMCLGADTGCCSAFTACDMPCQQCTGTPTASTCTGNAKFQAVETCLNTTCGSSCTFSICGSMLGYPTAACNFCLSDATHGCCSQFTACTTDTTSTCYKCVTGAETNMATCMADANFTAYNTCFTTNCQTACGG